MKHRMMLFFIGSISGIFALGYGSVGGTQDMTEILILTTLILLGLSVLGLHYRSFMSIPIIFLLICGAYMIGRGAYDSSREEWKILSPYINGQKHAIEGTISKMLFSSERTDSYRLIVDKIDNISPYDRGDRHIFDSWRSISLIVEVPNNRRLLLNQNHVFTGKILPVVDGKIEGFERYAFRGSLFGKIRIDDPLGSIPRDQIPFSIGDWAEKSFFSGFPKKTAGILAGMTLGKTNLMEKGVEQRFMNAGMTHILVVSGSNIALVILMITFFMRYIPLGRAGRIGLITLFILLYAGIVGFEPPVIRAVIMGILTYLALEYGSKLRSILILLMIACIYLMIDPLALVYDASFGLSFGATYGILIMQGKRENTSWIRNILLLTTGAMLGSLPAMIFHFGGISVGSFIANILIAPIVGLILIGGTIYLLLSILGIPGILYILGIPLYLSIEYVDLVAKYMGSGGIFIIPHEWIVPTVFGIIACIIVTGAYQLNHFGIRKNHQKLSHQPNVKDPHHRE